MSSDKSMYWVFFIRLFAGTKPTVKVQSATYDAGVGITIALELYLIYCSWLINLNISHILCRLLLIMRHILGILINIFKEKISLKCVHLPLTIIPAPN
jgi:hypothetical protein